MIQFSPLAVLVVNKFMVFMQYLASNELKTAIPAP